MSLFGFFKRKEGKLLQFPNMKPIPPREDGPMKKEPKLNKYFGIMLHGLGSVLPQTPEDLEEYMEALISEFQLPNNDFTREMICTIILHLPQERGSIEPVVIADRVRKSIANSVAYNKTAEFNEKRKQEAAAAASKQAETQPEASANVGTKPVQNG